MNSLNPCFMSNLFKFSETRGNVRSKCKLSLDIPVVSQVTSGAKNLRSFKLEIWNSLPHHVDSAEYLDAF